jgi:ribonuclease P protein component
VLPAAARLRRRQEFTDVVRRGRRASRGPLTIHLDRADDGTARVGFVIGKIVGPAVVRNRLRRRLRHLLRARLDRLPPGTRLVVRAREGAGELGSPELARLVDGALRLLDAA